MKVSIKKMRESAKIPERGSSQAAGYDLFANIDEPAVIIPAHSTKMISTGIALAVPDGYFAGIYARSGLSSKEGLRPANCVGVVDSDYRGEVFVALHNDSDMGRTVVPGQKIAQMVIMPFLPVEFNLTDDLDTTERGAGGFGSTGK